MSFQITSYDYRKQTTKKKKLIQRDKKNDKI